MAHQYVESIRRCDCDNCRAELTDGPIYTAESERSDAHASSEMLARTTTDAVADVYDGDEIPWMHTATDAPVDLAIDELADELERAVAEFRRLGDHNSAHITVAKLAFPYFSTRESGVSWYAGASLEPGGYVCRRFSGATAGALADLIEREGAMIVADRLARAWDESMILSPELLSEIEQDIHSVIVTKVRRAAVDDEIPWKRLLAVDDLAAA